MAKVAGKKRGLRSVTGNTGHVRNVGERSKTIGISSTQVAERFEAGKREKKIMIFFLGGGGGAAAFAFRLLKAEGCIPRLTDFTRHDIRVSSQHVEAVDSMRLE